MSDSERAGAGFLAYIATRVRSWGKIPRPKRKTDNDNDNLIITILVTGYIISVVGDNTFCLVQRKATEIASQE